MLSRTAFRSHRAALRPPRGVTKRNVRWQSGTSKATPDTAAGSGALTGGVAGGAAALLVVYGWYQLSGTKSAVTAAKQTKQYVDSTVDSLKVKFEENTPGTDEAIKTLRDSANKYAAFIPGARQYVDTAFQDLETVRKRHGPEVDSIVSEAYSELRDASKNGMNMQTAGQVYQTLTKHLQRLLELGKDAAEDVLENHPQLKDKLGGSADQLKQLGEQIGPKAKKEIDDAWKQVDDLVQQGMQAGTAMQAYSLLQEKIQKLRQMGEEAFDQGFQQLKPILEKNPQIKDFVEKNKDTLQKGNISETINKVKDAVQSGGTQDLQQYIDQMKEKAQSFGSSRISEWLDKIPQGSEILPQLQKLRKIAEQRGEDAEKLAKETISELKQVLDRKTQEAEKLAEGAKEEARK